MGCNACKIGFGNQQQAQEIKSGALTVQSTSSMGLLSASERQLWINNLNEPHQPDQSFWQSFGHSSHPCFMQIKKDIPRSFPNCRFFSKPDNVHRFQTLLRKFAIYFPKVGYTQGINFLAGYLLIAGFTDQVAFKILVRLSINQKLMFIGLYQQTFPLNRLYCAVFWKLLEKRQPNTALKIKLANVIDQIWIFQWFMTCFLYSFPVEFVKKFFDYVICKKQFSLVTLSLGIVNCLKPDIMSMQNPDEFDFFQYLDNLKSIEFCSSKINIDKVIIYANSITKNQISKALQQVKMSKNIYYTYFRRQKQQKQIWNEINQKLIKQRRIFQLDPRSSQYIRDLNSVEHLQRLLLRKSKLYRSRTDSKFSSQIKTSNFTVQVQPQQQIASDGFQRRISANNNTPNYFMQYGGIREGVQAKQQRQRRNLANQVQKMSKNNQYFMIGHNSDSISRESRNNRIKNY